MALGKDSTDDEEKDNDNRIREKKKSFSNRFNCRESNSIYI